MAASSTYGRFNGISRTLSFTKHSYFLISNFRHCIIIVSINYIFVIVIVIASVC